jgi:hypothetical protein
VRVWKNFNARHGGRFVCHFTLLHASWVQSDRVAVCHLRAPWLRHASHTSIAYLRQRTQDFIAQRNRSPKPFKWTFAGLELQTGEPRRFAPHAHTLRSRAAAELRGHLAKLIGHDYARVRAYGKHLLIQMRRKDAVDTVARLTEVARNRYTAASQPHRALGAIADCRRSGARCRRSHDSSCAVP